MQQVDSNGNLTYYFYVVVEYGEAIKYQKTYIIGQGEFKQPRRTKLYKTMQRMLDTWDNRVVSCGYALEPPFGCTYTHPSHDFTADPTTT